MTGEQSDFALWQERFVRRYIVKARRKRYLMLLRDRKTRRKILERLNHTLDYDESKARVLTAAEREPDTLLSFLQGRGVDEVGHVTSDGGDADGATLPLREALTAVLDNSWGAVLICPPIPIALYKEEDIGRLILLDDRARKS